MSTSEYKPGQKCEASGIYAVVHDRNHHSAHEVTVVHGEPFPPCKGCGQGARFRAVRLAHHVKNHDSF